MMYRFVVVIGLLASVAFLESCYKNGPVFSIRTKMGRLDNYWISTAITDQGIAMPGAEDSINASFSKTTKLFTYKILGSDSTYFGNWDWTNGKKSVNIILDKHAGPAYNVTNPGTYKKINKSWRWDITQLKNKNLSVIYTDDNGHTVEVIFRANGE